MRYEYELTLLFGSRLSIRHPAGRDAILYDIAAPISARKSRVYFFILRNHDHDLPLQDYVDFQQKILDEDQPMVEDQRPEDLPLELTEEVHIHADRFAIAFRLALGQLGLGRPFSA
jgi:phenylpropionate dioxygenase-like ring-hydroxylating dioxygenase large terminal subunit